MAPGGGTPGRRQDAARTPPGRRQDTRQDVVRGQGPGARGQDARGGRQDAARTRPPNKSGPVGTAGGPVFVFCPPCALDICPYLSSQGGHPAPPAKRANRPQDEGNAMSYPTRQKRRPLSPSQRADRNATVTLWAVVIWGPVVLALAHYALTTFQLSN
jgi:hypothetical protein